jgi:hypothetical protein
MGWYHTNNPCLTDDNMDWYVVNGWCHNNIPCLVDDIWYDIYRVYHNDIESYLSCFMIKESK